MTLRQYYAAKALQGLLTNPVNNKCLQHEFAKAAFELADEMLGVEKLA